MATRYINLYRDAESDTGTWSSSPYESPEEAEENRGGQYPGSSLTFLACVPVEWEEDNETSQD